MMTGRRLIANIDAAGPGKGQCALWWLGQQSFVAKLGGRILYLDPFLTDLPGRCLPPLLKPEQITHADFIFGSHNHADHIDRPAWPILARTNPRATFVVPSYFLESLPQALGIPASRFLGLNDGMTVRRRGLTISAVAAAHELLRPDSQGRHPFLSFVIAGNGFTMLHGGDMCLYEGLQTKLARWRFDVAMLPINGRDAVRLRDGCIGNMTYQEAVDLAGALGPGLTIPAHYGMFAGNTENPELFVDYARVKYPGLRTRCCTPGQRVLVEASRSSR